MKPRRKTTRARTATKPALELPPTRSFLAPRKPFEPPRTTYRLPSRKRVARMTPLEIMMVFVELFHSHVEVIQENERRRHAAEAWRATFPRPERRRV